MQRLGKEVWAINTVEFSNHTGYGAWRGKALGGELAADLVAGLGERGVLPHCEAVLSGYMGDAGVAQAIAGAVHQVRAASPKALYCCDPVMGDTGRGIYVKPDIPAMFLNDLVPLADIVTPNQFELETLTGIGIKGMDDARRAIDMLHEKGPGIVLVTSYRDDGDPAQAGTRDTAHIGMLASDRTGVYMVRTPEIPITTDLAGSGDVTTAVFLSRYLETGDVRRALELCTASVFGILEASWKYFSERRDAAMSRTRLMELRIVQAQRELDNPSRFFEASRV